MARRVARSRASMAEVAAPGEHHRDAGVVDGLDHFGVADRAAGLDDGADARSMRELGAVGEREEGVGGERGAGDVRRAPSRPRGGPSRRGSSGRRRSRSWRRSRAITIALERTCLQTRQANSRSSTPPRSAALGDDLHLSRSRDPVAVLHEQRPGHLAEVRSRRVGGGARGVEDAQVLGRLRISSASSS